ncbi:hypothetical protein ACF07T_41215 [Streptomyces sp. NPDC015184]|uniref:hypothetical protein n=1 Tax=Streptomyces sp. NPDC015184 TaxID=3364946 RepID=UPI0036F7D05C
MRTAHAPYLVRIPRRSPSTSAPIASDPQGLRTAVIDLIDILKEAEFATGFTGEFTSVATREAVPKAVLRRLLLVLFAEVILSS